MDTIDTGSPVHERIFAAAADLQSAYESGEAPGQEHTPLSEALVLLTLEAVDEVIDDLGNAWRAGPTRPVPFPPGKMPVAAFPDILDVRSALNRMVTEADQPAGDDPDTMHRFAASAQTDYRGIEL